MGWSVAETRLETIACALEVEKQIEDAEQQILGTRCQNFYFQLHDPLLSVKVLTSSSENLNALIQLILPYIT